MTTLMTHVPTPTPTALQRAADAGVFLHDTTTGRRRVAALFPGHGSQYPDMGAHLFGSGDAARDLLAEADRITRDIGGFAISEQFLTAVGGPDVPARLKTPAAMQCGIFVVSMAIHGELLRLGLRPDVYAGHSLGELGALTAAGVLSFADGLRAVHARAMAVSALTGPAAGAMLGLTVPDDEARRTARRLLLRAQARGTLVEAIENAPSQLVISGEPEAVDSFADSAKQAGLSGTRLRASHAFHSPVLDRCARDLTARLAGLTWQSPRTPVFSSILMDYYTVDDLPHLPQILGRQLVTPFSFRRLLGRLDDDGVGIFVESGPGSILTKLVTANGVAGLAVPADRRGQRGMTAIADAVVAATTVAGGPDRAGADHPADRAGATIRNRQAEVTAVIGKHTGYPATVVAPGLKLGAGLAIVESVRTAIRADLLGATISEKDWPSAGGRAEDVSIAEILGVPVDSLCVPPADRPDAAPADRSGTVSWATVKVRTSADTPDDPGTETAGAGGSARADAGTVPDGSFPDVPVAEGSSPGDTAGLGRERLVELVVGVFAARTGYPAELIEPGLDLEADLGVDSVKQAEVLGVLGAEHGLGSEGMDLSGLSSVDAIVDALLVTEPAAPDPAAAEPAAAEPAGAEPAAAEPIVAEPIVDGPSVDEVPAGSPPDVVAGGSGLGRERLVELVVGVFAARTGYPAELIEPGLDLEADLGVDSVKQAEVLGVLGAEHGLGSEGMDLSGLSSVDAIVDALLATEPAAPEPRPSVTEPDPASAGHAPARRYVPELVLGPVAASAPRRSLDGHRFLLLADDGAALAGHVVTGLRAAGATVAVVAPDELSAKEISTRFGGTADSPPIAVVAAPYHRPEEIAAACALAHADLGDVTGLVDLTTYTAVPPALPDGGAGWDENLDAAFVALFTAVREVYDDLRAAGASATVGVATRTGGGFGLDPREDGNPLGGVPTGFVKSLHRELPDCHVRAVDVAPVRAEDGVDPALAAGRLVDELCLAQPDDGLEIAYLGDRRHVVKVIPVPVRPGVPAHELTAADTVVFSGGSRGIALECLSALARRTGVRVVVLGRTRLDDPADQPYLHLTDEEFDAARGDYLRAAALAHPGSSPVELNQLYRRTANARLLARHLTTRLAGAEISYHACDVTDAASVASVAEKLRDQGAVVRGVVHAAGLESFGAVPKKPFDHSREVVRVKGRGLSHLWHAFAGPDLRFFYSFGSISGRFGMDGQVDYTAGAGLLSVASALLGRAHPGTDVKTLGWTAWAEVGMAESPQVRAVQEARGLTYMGVGDGVAHFLAELDAGPGEAEVLFFGQLGSNEPAGQLTALTSDRAAVGTPVDPDTGVVLDRSTLPVLDTVRLDGRRAEASRRLSERRDLYLLDHLVKGAPTFPGVMHVESMAQTALALAGTDRAFQIVDAEFVKFVKVAQGREVDLAVEAELGTGPDADTVRCALRSDLRAANGTLLEAGRLHSRLTVRLLDDHQAPPVIEPIAEELLDRPGTVVDLDRYYTLSRKAITFGPSFRCLRRAAMHGDVIIGEICLPYRSGLFSDLPAPRFHTAPLLLDNAGRLALLHAVHHRGVHVVPVRIRDGVMSRPPVAGEKLLARVRVFEHSNEGTRISIEVSDTHGDPLISIGSIELTTIARLNGGRHDLLS